MAGFPELVSCNILNPWHIRFSTFSKDLKRWERAWNTEEDMPQALEKRVIFSACCMKPCTIHSQNIITKSSKIASIL